MVEPLYSKSLKYVYGETPLFQPPEMRIYTTSVYGGTPLFQVPEICIW